MVAAFSLIVSVNLTMNCLQVREIICKYLTATTEIRLLKNLQDQFELNFRAEYLKRYKEYERAKTSDTRHLKHA